MNRINEVKEIIAQNVSITEKKRLMKNLLIDLENEMEAQDQNMQPEIEANLSKAYQLANQYLLDKDTHE